MPRRVKAAIRVLSSMPARGFGAAAMRELPVPGNASVIHERLPPHRQLPPPRALQLDAQPTQLEIDIARSVLVIIDMQNDFCGEGGWISSMGIDFAAARALVDPINRVAAALRAANVPILWVNWGVRPDRAPGQYRHQVLLAVGFAARAARPRNVQASAA